jgi:SAM-dependent methyltransferase
MTEINRQTVRDAQIKFDSAVGRARQAITDPQLLEAKWLRNRPNLFGNYFQKYCLIDPPLGSSIFDLGCGPGYLLWICKNLGQCKIQGLDSKDRDDLRTLWHELEIEPVIQIGRIKAHKSLDLAGRYDVISSTYVCFNHTGGQPWDAAAYIYFLEDVNRYLMPNGFLYLLFNHPIDQEVRREMSKLGKWEGSLSFRMPSRSGIPCDLDATAKASPPSTV